MNRSVTAPVACQADAFADACERLSAASKCWGPELRDRLECVLSGRIALCSIDFGAADRAGNRVLRLEPTEAFSELVAACVAAKGNRKICEAAFDHFETSFDDLGHSLRPSTFPTGEIA
ncbi:MAG: hypothetical protein EPN45_21205 [Rhizobiaceae bacterium]|nr:MAG: hypothetical protein EPN45_21205 [Rhizobiaceae bacterium]